MFDQLRNQKTSTSNKYNYIKGGSFFNLVLLMFHHRFSNATQIWRQNILIKDGEQEKLTE